MKKATLAGIAGAAMFTSLGVAQEVHVFGGEAQTFEFRTISDGGFGVGKVVTGLPFSADETTTTTQVLADGNRIVNSSTSKVYRDAQGRTRTESTLGNIGALPASEARVSIMINDPVAGTHYVVSPNEHSFFKMEAAHQVASDQMVMKMADEAKAKARTEASNTPTLTYSTMARHSSMEKPGKTEDLGNQNMEGVLVKGTRTTTTIAAGSMGNDRDINIVMERWYSPELQMNIMTKRTDPRMGETVFQVTNLNRSNPDPSLFVPPADYQLKEGMKGAAFTKAITIQK